MAINLRAPEVSELRPRITVLGVGGAGGNAVNNMIAAKLEGVDFIVANTDAQALAQSRAERRIQIGARITEGLGAGAHPDVGRAAAEESLNEVLEQLSGSHMVFITAGMGGGTGTGAAPAIARAVRDRGVLTVGVVTKPFAFEGARRMRIAEQGIEELQAFVDTLIIIPNQNLFRVATERTTFAQAFSMADEVLHSGVRGVTDLIVMPGLINLDFADIKTVMSEMGKAMMGTGEAEGEGRALKAAESAISNPLLDDVSMKGARGVLINITGGADMMLTEVDEAATRIRQEVDPDANIIFGGTILENMEGRIRVSVVSTGIDAERAVRMPPNVTELQTVAKLKTAAATAARDSFNPVKHQVDALERTLSKKPAADFAGDREAVARVVSKPITVASSIVEEDVAPQPEERRHPEPEVRELRQAVVAPEPQQKRGGRLSGLFGGRKHKQVEPRMEPAVNRPAQPQRASAQVISRTQSAEPARPAQTMIDDFFADQPVDDHLEIPSFLRRQQN
ncbi:MAG: cell division protein FtsZ [Alphaproteobacteria bacterium]|nr:cell division protein FtsZ [Alphaproteobacteria bacterium]MDE2012381.1 cell division protein FtsZ [Alphaproteobacteria bacterium]MDE2073109.1 cell division protein FtsZ [Alphaproteobacteria bacterium]